MRPIRYTLQITVGGDSKAEPVVTVPQVLNAKLYDNYKRELHKLLDKAVAIAEDIYAKGEGK